MKEYLYFECQNLFKENINKLETLFKIKRLTNPNELHSIYPSIVASSAPLGHYYDKDFFDKLPNIKYLLTNTTGTQHIDQAEAKSRGIDVISLEGDSSFLSKITPTSEHALCLLIGASRNIFKSIDGLKTTKVWDRRPYVAPKMLSKATLGIVGFGRLGKQMHKISKAIFKSIQYYDPYVNSLECERLLSLKELVGTVDYLTIHVDVNESSIGLINKQILSVARQNLCIVNTSRGEIVNQKDILDALDKKKICAYAADVIEGEFEPSFNLSDNILFKESLINSSITLTPHIAGSTMDAWHETQARVIERLINEFENA